MDDLDLDLVLRGHGRNDNKGWSGCRSAPKVEIGGLPQEGAVVRPQAWGSGTVE